TIDRVLVQGYGLAALAANLCSRLTRTPTFMLVCSPVERYYECRREHPLPGLPFKARELWGLRLLARMNARLGRHYVVLSEHLAQVVRGHGTSRPISVVPVYGVDTTVFSPRGEDRSTIRRRKGLPEWGSLLFFSSRVAPEKDTDTLLEALKRLANAGRDVRLLHRSGGYRDFLQLARAKRVADRLIATDAVHPNLELADDYRACDICIQASREEGLGFSVLEALACEVPVIASAVGGLRETIINGETGWTYPPGDSGALADRIEEVLEKPAEARRRAARGRAMVTERYESRVAFDRLAKLLVGSEAT
ncbi:MAG: glycosyltransferase family 4 protein, partial [Gemmatimonadales bacterium]